MAGAITQALKLTTALDPSGLNALHAKMDDLDSHAGKTSGLFSKLGDVVKIGLLAGGAAGIAGLGASVKLAGDFEGAINAIGASTGASTAELKKLHDAALQVGKDTPKSATEAAEAFGELARAGVSADDIVKGVGRTAVDFAVSQGAAIPAMANLLTSGLTTFKSTLAGYGDASAQAQHVAGVLAAAASSSAVDINDIAFSLSAVGPVASQAGLSVDDFGAAIGLLGNNALKGSDAGTSLKTMLLSLMAPTSTGAAVMDQLGIAVYDAEGKMKPFRDIIGILHDKLSGLSEEERNMAMKTIFGTDAIRAGNIIVSEGVEGWDKFNAQMKAAPSLQDQTAQRMKGLNGQIEQLKGSLETAAIIVGEKVLPLFTAAATGATNVVNKLIEGDWSGAAAAIGDGLLSGLTAIRDFGGRLLGWLGDTLRNTDWGATGSAITDGLLTGLAAAADFASRFGDWLGEQIGSVDWAKVWANIKTGGVNLFGSGFLDITNGLENIASFVQTKALPAVQEFFDYLRSQVAPAALEATQGLFSWLGDHKEVLVGAAAGIGVVTVAWQVYNAVVAIAAFVTGTLLSPVVLITAAAVALGAGIALLVVHWDDITAKFPVLGQIVDAVGGKLHEFGDWLQVSFVPNAVALFSSISNAIGAVITFVRTNWDTISSLLAGPLQIAKALLLSVWGDIENTFETSFAVIKGIFDTFAALFRGDWEGVWAGIQEIFTAIWEGIGRYLQNRLDLITGIAEGAWTTLKATASFLWGQIGNTVTGAAHGIWQWFQDHWVDVLGTVLVGPFFLFRDQLGDAATGVLGTIWSNITNAFSGLLNWYKTVWSELKDHAIAPFQWLLDNGPTIFRAVGNAILQPFRDVLSGLSAFIGGVASAVNWVTDKLGLGNVMGTPNWSIPQLASGTDNWRGGLALVGEAGPELAYLPEGTAVVPADRTRRLLAQYSATEIQALPGFQFGLDPGKVLDTLKGAWGSVSAFVGEWLGKGAEALVAQAFSQFGVSGDFGGNFLAIPRAIFTTVKDGVVAGVKELLGLAGKAQPPETAPGPPGGVPGQPLLSGTGWGRPLAGGYAITTYFGQPGALWSRGWHSGMDLASFSGDTVYAALGGSAVNLGDGGSGFGQHVVIAHGGGLQSIYGHLGSFLTSGGTVSTGQAIGTEDNTGLSTGTHLHFEIDLNGSPVNPLNYVGLAAGSANFPGGWAWVGEEGPELAYLPHGAAVLPNPLALALAGGAVLPGFAGGLVAGQPGYPGWEIDRLTGSDDFLADYNAGQRFSPAELTAFYQEWQQRLGGGGGDGGFGGGGGGGGTAGWTTLGGEDLAKEATMQKLVDQMAAIRAGLDQAFNAKSDEMAQIAIANQGIGFSIDAAGRAIDGNGRVLGQIDQHTLDTIANGNQQIAALQAQYDSLTAQQGTSAATATNTGQLAGTVDTGSGAVKTRAVTPLSSQIAFFGPTPDQLQVLLHGFTGKTGTGLGTGGVAFLDTSGTPPGGLSGFQAGGLLREPVVGWGRSGRRYSFAETGPEWFGGVGGAPSQTVYQFGDVQMLVPVDQLRQMTDLIDVFDRIVQTARARGVG